MQNKSRSLGRKTTEKSNLIGITYGQNNIRDSSVSNNSNPNGGAASNIAGYSSSTKSKFGTNNQPAGYNMMNNFMGNSNLP
jgi:hypothetical protein